MRPALVMALWAAPAFAGGSQIAVRVLNLRSSKGSVYCRLFARGDGFPKDGYATQQSVPIVDQSAACTFSDVAAGTYAISVFHDENGNGKLDTNFIGIPKEGVGVSNNRLHAMGPPRWGESSFKVSGDVTLEVKLRY